ncbi:MAG: hypothetical protein OMM_05661 [Candidatus Magnetoglobus multicellularis str. Araruama]|uniref:Uncharacterized protein n=1 Tax=Candidatus Magnetoglobus multicellularis str. Araruama TaxID=890399 RepID=A0A1V1NV14_9BACT|nr:MAG: hypothetical protein OMM_05661 [Candidatus Magnetoglobus multicellularis str. Araruama]
MYPNGNNISNVLNDIISYYDNSNSGWGLSKRYYRSEYDTCLALNAIAYPDITFDPLAALLYLESSISHSDDPVKISYIIQPKKCNLIVKIFYNQLNLILIFYLKVNLYFHLIGESKLLL